MVNIFTPSGRIGRLERFTYGIGIMILGYVINIAIPSLTIYYIMGIIFSWWFLMLDIKRFHDIGWDGSFLVMWYLFNILISYLFYKNLWLNKFTFTLDFDNHPQQAIVRAHALMGFIWIWLLANIVLNCILLFKKGTDGPNEYGPNPLKPDSNYQHHFYQHSYPSLKEEGTIYLTEDMIYRDKDYFDENDKVIIQRGNSEIIVTNKKRNRKRKN